MTQISNERLAELLAEVEIEQENAVADAEADQNPQLTIDAVAEFDLSEMRSLITELQALRASSGVEVKPAEIEDLIEQLLDAQQDINLAANENMDQSLCDASALIDKVEAMLNRILSCLSSPLTTVEVTEELQRLSKALAVYSKWTIDVATLGELADLEKRLAAEGFSLEDVGRWSPGTAALSQNKGE